MWRARPASRACLAVCCWAMLVLGSWGRPLANPQVDAELDSLQTIDKKKSKDPDFGCDPFEVHLALAEDDASLRVAWRTSGSDCGTAVSYGLDEQFMSSMNGSHDIPLLQTAMGITYALTEDIMCSAPARHTPFHVTMHVARLMDLRPSAPYWYRILGSTRTYTFRAPPRAGLRHSHLGMELQSAPNANVSSGLAGRVSFFAFGDMGESTVRAKKSPMAATTMATMLAEHAAQPVDLVLHMGDLAYANGKHSVWDSFMDMIEPLASQVPYMVGVGNHEYCYMGPPDNDPSGVLASYHPWWGNYGSDSGGECGAMSARRFAMPSDPKDNAPFWYGFNNGNVHFTVISTEHDISPGSTQYRWLEMELASVDRCATPWLVVGLHRPLYVVYPHKDNRVVGDHLRDFIEGLLLEYQVDLTVAGHVHTYYRTCDVRAELCTPDKSGLVHFVAGTGGHELSEVVDEQKEWLEADINDWGFLRMDVDGTRMDVRFILSSSGKVGDSVTLYADAYTPEECSRLAGERTTRLEALRLKHEAEAQQQQQAASQEQQQQAESQEQQEQAESQQAAGGSDPADA